MKIALFTETYTPHINGVVTHVKILRDGLIKLGHEVLVVTADCNAKKHYIDQNYILHCPAIKSSYFYDYSLSPPFSMERYKLIKWFSPDVIHIHNEFGIGLSGVFIGKKLSIPIVYTIHTMYDDCLFYITPKHCDKIVEIVAHKYSKFFAKKATVITAPSVKCQRYFDDIGVNTKVDVIDNPYESDLFYRCKEENCSIYTKLNIDKEKINLCFVGRLGKEKGTDILLKYLYKAKNSMPNFHLYIIGNGPEYNTLKGYADKYLPNYVTLLGYVKHENLPQYYRCFDYYITASLADTNSISMLEAMACGLPVIQRYDEMNKEQIVNGVNGFSFKDYNEMGNLITNLYNLNEQEKSSLCLSTTNSVKNRGCIYLANELCKRYSKLYNN